MSGCCAPCGGTIGPGCLAGASCNDCNGGGVCTPCARGPIDALRNARRRAICGSGCGETYVGEWISTPPDCNDPCCDSQFVGGAQKARPFCWERGALVRGLYGRRVCSGNASSADCACRDNICDRISARRAARCSCDTCSAGYETYVEQPYIGETYVEEAYSAPASSCGCASGSCSARSSSVSRTAKSKQHASSETIVR